jgi:hypothetical protein
MRRFRGAAENVLSLSFLDLISCGLGATILLFFGVVFSSGGVATNAARASGGSQAVGTFGGTEAGRQVGDRKGADVPPYFVVEVRFEAEIDESDVYWLERPATMDAYVLHERGDAPRTTFIGVFRSSWPNRLYFRSGAVVPAGTYRICLAGRCDGWRYTMSEPDPRGTLVMAFGPRSWSTR